VQEPTHYTTYQLTNICANRDPWYQVLYSPLIPDQEGQKNEKKARIHDIRQF